MKLNSKIIIAAIILGILSTMGVYLYINSVLGTREYIKVWTAKKNIAPNTKIDETMIEVKNIPQNLVVKNALLGNQQIKGSVLLEQVMEGEQILSNKLLSSDNSKFSFKVPIGKRALTIAVDDVAGVAYLMKPGDYVDVLAFFPQEKGENKNRNCLNIEKIILHKVLILAMDSDIPQKNSNETTASRKKVTLAVTQTEAEKLTLGDSIGKLRLALINPQDKQDLETTGTTRGELLSDK